MFISQIFCSVSIYGGDCGGGGLRRPRWLGDSSGWGVWAEVVVVVVGVWGGRVEEKREYNKEGIWVISH